MKGRILAINVSSEKGVPKTSISEANLIADFGIEGDAHAGPWHRQISLLADESADKIRALGVAGIVSGRFAENLTTSGLRLWEIPVGSLLRVGEVEMELTQIGKECHTGCAIQQTVGQCVMPREGIFARVLKGGRVRAGDELEVFPARTVGIIVASDSGAKGERQDASGLKIADMVEAAGYRVIDRVILPDDIDALANAMRDMADRKRCSLILTTGGTGFSRRDNTPEATLQVVERLTPGICEAMRWASFQKTPKAILSRAVSGIRGTSIIVNLPGSPKAVEECLSVVLAPLAHGVEILSGEAILCGEPG